MGRAPTYILDGTAMAYRAFHALRRQDLSSSSGQATGAVYGFVQILETVLRTAGDDRVVATFDAAARTFRHEMFPDYKATRERMPEELQAQMPYMQRILEAKGIRVVILPGYEADDIMATLALRLVSEDEDCILVTSDKDMAQLVSDRIRLMPPPKAGIVSLLGPAEVEEKYGVPPSLIRDFMALTGDTSDNVPGVPGVGPKRAGELLREFGNLDGVLAHAAEVRLPSVRAALLEHGEKAWLARDLVTVCTDVPGLPEDVLQPGVPDPKGLRDLFTELEFASLAAQVEVPDDSAPAADYVTVTTEAGLEAALEELAGAEVLAFDLETTSLDPLAARPVGISLCGRPLRAFYVPLGDQGVPIETAVSRLRPLLEDSRRPKGGQNSKYDIQVLRSMGIDVRGLTFDTMVASYLIDPNLKQRNLDFLALRYLGVKKIPTSSLIGNGREITMDLVPVDQVARYACEDADVALRLHLHFAPMLAAMGLDRLYREVEVPLVPVLAAMERTGICLDVSYVSLLGRELDSQLADLRHDIHTRAGEEFNINSPQQLGYILFDKLAVHTALGIKRLRKTKSGYSTDAAVLETMAEHPLVALVLEYRNVAKLKNTYVDALPKLADSVTGRIHTSFNQTVTATGRLSSSNPNLQNIPIRTELGRRLRRAFVAPPGHVLMSADYSQIELRILAHLCGDEGLAEAFASDEDIHRSTAARILDIPVAEVTHEQRSRAKAINYGLIYGMGPRRLARDSGISMAEAETFIARYFSRFPGVKRYMDSVLQKAKTEGGVRTMLGRWRPIPEIASSDGGARQAAERAAMNTPIQGSAADLMKVAMLKVFEALAPYGDAASMLLQVHDELVLEIAADVAEPVRRVVTEAMENALPLSVPLRVDIGVGPTWFDTK
ncbi:DNA polymerase I [Candidatus Fermentibacteria bacterium]|nr:DNA polymerase I [Candidatus Fermentibacteria bacterium]